MNDFEGLLPSDYGFKPSSNKSAPISGSRSTRPASNSFSGSLEPDSIFAARSTDFASDVLGGSARRAARSPPKAYDFDSVFDNRSNSDPVYDKPVYDDDLGGGGVDVGDIFHGVPGIRSSTAAGATTSSSKVKFDDVFSSVSSSPPKRGGNVSAFDDLLGGFGKAEAVPAPAPRWKSSGAATRPERSEKKSVSDFDDLLPGFGASSFPSERSTETFTNSNKTTSKVMEDPFVSTGKFIDPLEEISKFSNSRTVKSDSVGNGRLFDDMDPFDGLVRPASSFSSERENRGKETSNLRTESNNGGTQPFTTREVHEKPSVRSPDNHTERKAPVENDWDSNQTIFDIPTASTDAYKSFGQTMSPPSYASASFKDSNTHSDRSPRSEEDVDSSNDIWISVLEVPLVTQPTSAPPPSRPPPPKPVSKTSSSNARRMNNEFSSFPNPSQNPNSAPAPAAGRSPVVSPIDEFEDFAWGTRQDNANDHVNGLSGEEELEMNSAAAAMKEAMDRAQAKFRQAKEVRERENSKATRSKEGHHQERDEKFAQDERVRERQERLERQRLQREKEEEDRERQRLEREREEARETEEREREQRRLEKEKERAREIERERERGKQAVERATREARERAAIDARQKVERAKAERAAVDKATSEARERAERVAVQRAQAEARERAAAEAKERAERATAEARERESSEAKEKEARERAAVARAEAESRSRAAERAAVGRAASEARERAGVEARARAAAARASQQKNENDIESFFSSRASSAPRSSSTSTTDPFFDAQPQPKRETEVPRPPSGNSSNIKKASSSTNIVDDLSSIFGAPSPASGGFQDLEGETEERRRARLERHQRTQERAAKALAEKNQRDLQMQRDQAERSRFGETLDAEIKRWAAGKEGNLRALLSTLQYVLWPESGWQAVSLTDLITGASVKKVYRKATLCIHPDKVQQKGANLQQKYVAEKVFDLLKEAWNKFNSEELF